MIKPDAVAAGAEGQIVSRFESMGFAILRMEMKHLSADEAERFYELHRGKEFYERLVEFITSGPVLGILLEGPDAVVRIREAMGATDPALAAEGTLRKLFGTTITHNAVHGSDSHENALREAKIFFGE